MTIVKNLMEKPFFFIMDFQGSYAFLLRHKYFDLHTFDNEMTGLVKCFEISTEMHFVSLVFLNEKYITASLFMIHLKCVVAHYANFNSTSINKSYLRAVKYTISFFFQFLIYVFFKKAFVKTLCKSHYFLKQNSKIHFKM